MSISDSAPYEILQYTPSGTISACAPKPLSEISKEELEVIALLAINEYKQNSTTNGLTISDFKVGDVEVETATYTENGTVEIKLKPKKAKVKMIIEVE